MFVNCCLYMSSESKAEKNFSDVTSSVFSFQTPDVTLCAHHHSLLIILNEWSYKDAQS